MSKPCVILPATAEGELSKLNPIFKKRGTPTHVVVAPYSTSCQNRVRKQQRPIAPLPQQNLLNDIAPGLAQEIEKQLIRHNLARLIKSWLVKHDAALFQTQPLANIELWVNNVVLALCRMLQYFNCGEYMLLASMLLAERFIDRNGGVKQVHMFDVLFISSLVTVKMWEDSRTSNQKAAVLAGKTLQQINMMERVFLSKIDYSLYISSAELESFIERIKLPTSEQQQQFKLQFQQQQQIQIQLQLQHL